MRKIIGWLVILIMAIWSVVSWYWYTCKITGFCGQKTEKLMGFILQMFLEETLKK